MICSVTARREVFVGALEVCLYEAEVERVGWGPGGGEPLVECSDVRSPEVVPGVAHTAGVAVVGMAGVVAGEVVGRVVEVVQEAGSSVEEGLGVEPGPEDGEGVCLHEEHSALEPVCAVVRRVAVCYPEEPRFWAG